MRHDQGLYRFRVGQRVRDKHTGKCGTVRCCSFITAAHFQVAMDDGYDTLLIDAELEPAEAEARAAGAAGKYRIGEKVFVDSIEGFGGEGTVVEYLPAQNKGHEDRYRIDLPSAGWSEPGVCWDHEISRNTKESAT